MSIFVSIKNKIFGRSFYQGASRTAANRDFNNAANSTFETTAKPDRAMLRARARWMSANNIFMNNIDESIINLVVGTGITVQMRLDSSDMNSSIEDSYDRWAKTIGWYDMQRLMMKSRMVDGEVFIYIRPDAMGLKVQLIESDALDDGKLDGGITRDKEGNPTKYRFKTVDTIGNYTQKTVEIDARYIRHFFNKTRPTQQRGISEYSQAMQITKNLDAFNQSVVQAARARASIAYIIARDGNISGLDIEKKDDGSEIEYIGDVAVHYLKTGESISKTAPGSSDTEYNSFNESTIHQVCNARNISYELGFADASKTNYSSFRASLQKDYKRIAVEQQKMFSILDWVFEAWMEVEILSGRLKGIPYQKFLAEPYLYTKKNYITPEVITVDPLKERLAEEKAVKLNRLSESMLAHKAGTDYEDIVAQKAMEIEILDKYGLMKDPTTGDIIKKGGAVDGSN